MENEVLQAQIDEALTANTILMRGGKESRECYTLLLDIMSYALGTEYIASRLLALGLTIKEDKKMQYNIMCENLEDNTVERLDWTNDYEEALRWMDEYIREDEQEPVPGNCHYWVEEVEVDD